MAADGNWTSGEAYENFVGRWSRLVAREFIGWLDAPQGARWLDVGCGTGELSRCVRQFAAPAHVTGVDPSTDYVSYAREQSLNIEYKVGDATGLPMDGASFDVVVSGLVLNFVTDKPAAAREMARVTKPGGIVAAYVRDYAEGMQMMRYFWDAAAALDPKAAELDEGKRFSICTAAGLDELFSSAGLEDVETHPIVVPTHFPGFNAYWRPFLGAQGPAGTFAASLNDEGRERMREMLKARLPVAEDGSIPLTARAWAAKGRVS